MPGGVGCLRWLVPRSWTVQGRRRNAPRRGRNLLLIIVDGSVARVGGTGWQRAPGVGMIVGGSMLVVVGGSGAGMTRAKTTAASTSTQLILVPVCGQLCGHESGSTEGGPEDKAESESRGRARHKPEQAAAQTAPPVQFHSEKGGEALPHLTTVSRSWSVEKPVSLFAVFSVVTERQKGIEILVNSRSSSVVDMCTLGEGKRQGNIGREAAPPELDKSSKSCREENASLPQPESGGSPWGWAGARHL